MGVDETPAHIAAVGQRAGNIDVDTAAVPRADAGVDLRLEGICRAFTHEVDRGRRVAGTTHQAIGAVQHVDLLVLGQVLITYQRAAYEGHARTVVFEGIDVETARSEFGTVGFGLLDGYRRCCAQCVLDTGDLEIVQRLAGDGCHALRGLLVGQAQFGGAG